LSACAVQVKALMGVDSRVNPQGWGVHCPPGVSDTCPNLKQL
jgi:hypothetical protein